MRTAVVLPAPFGPRMPRTVPGRAARAVFVPHPLARPARLARVPCVCHASMLAHAAVRPRTVYCRRLTASAWLGQCMVTMVHDVLTHYATGDLAVADYDMTWAKADPDHVPPEIDTTQPSVARVYDAILGGKDHSAAAR